MPNPKEPLQGRRGGNAWLHRFALLTACSTFPLLFIGGLVTSKGAGLAVPDWPTTFGYNMFLYPWPKMIGGIFYEHSHRLVASGVGLLTVVLALWLWFGAGRSMLRWLGVAALFLVVVQGVVGGLRVVLLEQTLAVIHACLAQAFFALVASLALLTSREWQEEPRRVEIPEAARIRRLGLLTTGLIYLQGVFGALLRYTGTGLEAHLLLALVVAAHVLFFAVRLSRSCGGRPGLSRPAVFLGVLLFAQLALGIGAYVGRFTSLWAELSPLAWEIITTSHVVTGALMLVTSLTLTLRSYRLLAPAGRVLAGRTLSEELPV